MVLSMVAMSSTKSSRLRQPVHSGVEFRGLGFTGLRFYIYIYIYIWGEYVCVHIYIYIYICVGFRVAKKRGIRNIYIYTYI